MAINYNNVAHTYISIYFHSQYTDGSPLLKKLYVMYVKLSAKISR